MNYVRICDEVQCDLLSMHECMCVCKFRHACLLCVLTNKNDHFRWLVLLFYTMWNDCRSIMIRERAACLYLPDECPCGVLT